MDSPPTTSLPSSRHTAGWIVFETSCAELSQRRHAINHTRHETFTRSNHCTQENYTLRTKATEDTQITVPERLLHRPTGTRNTATGDDAEEVLRASRTGLGHSTLDAGHRGLPHQHATQNKRDPQHRATVHAGDPHKAGPIVYNIDFSLTSML